MIKVYKKMRGDGTPRFRFHDKAKGGGSAELNHEEILFSLQKGVELDYSAVPVENRHALLLSLLHTAENNSDTVYADLEMLKRIIRAGGFYPYIKQLESMNVSSN